MVVPYCLRNRTALNRTPTAPAHPVRIWGRKTHRRLITEPNPRITPGRIRTVWSGSTGSAGDHTHGNGIRWPGGGGSALAFYDGGGFTYVQDSQYQVSPGTSSRRSYYQRIQTQSAGAHTHSLSGTAASSGAHAHTVGIGAHTHSVAIGSHGHTITVNAAGNAENTVKNIAFNYIVRLA